jgi:hypothetical protein
MDWLREADVPSFMIGEPAQIRHDQPLPRENRPEPELHMQPSALDAAEAAGILISHDSLPWLIARASAPSVMRVRMRLTGELDKANANGLA